jgi:hypothetical protein
MRRSCSTAFSLLVAAVLAGGCASLPDVKKYLPGGRKMPPDASARPASDVPDAFQSPAGLSPEGECRDPVHDARDGRAVHLVRSADGRGDYEVPEGRYGVGKGELLRIDCRTGSPMGIVER